MTHHNDRPYVMEQYEAAAADGTKHYPTGI